jgi:hypothetical protein
MKNQLLTLFILCIFFFSNAQEKNAVKYSEIFNDPYKIPNFGIIISPAYGDFGSNLTCMWNVGIRTMIKNRIILEGGYAKVYSKSLYDHVYNTATGTILPGININFHHPNNNSIYCTNNLKLTSVFEAGLGLVAGDKEKTVKEMINLSSVRGVNVIVNTVSYVDTRIRRLMIIRGGIHGYKSPIDIASKLSEDEYLEASDGTQFYWDAIKYPDVNYPNLEGITDYNKGRTGLQGDDGCTGWYTNMSIIGFYGGIATKKIRNMAIEAEGYGKRVKSNSVLLYFDVLYAPVKFDDIQFFGSNPSATVYGQEIGTSIKNYDLTGTGKHNINVNNLGFRIGYDGGNLLPSKLISWEKRDELSTIANIGYKVEGGMRPGIKGRGFYGMMTFYLQFLR